jgi:single-strand DNA-binding protein
MDKKKEEVLWHTIISWGALATVVEQFVQKGRTLHIEGALKYRKYLDKDSKPIQVAEIIADNIILLDKKPKDE